MHRLAHIEVWLTVAASKWPRACVCSHPRRCGGRITAKWGVPVLLVCDRFRLAELQDVVGAGVSVESRVSRWSEAAFDIRSIRKMAKDGPFAVEAESTALLATNLGRRRSKNDDQSNTRLSKCSPNNTAHNDVAAPLVLNAGTYARQAVRHVAGLGYILSRRSGRG